jgi:uncharacterized protein (DUF2141 family)
MQKIILGSILLVSSIVAYDISIKVKDIDNSGGKLYIGLYNKKKDFKDILKTYKNSIVDINSSTLKVIFKNVPKGFYAISLFHDKNGNGELDKNLFGVPTEGYGFSNNIRHMFRGANFEESKFELNEDREVVINIGY